MQNTEALKHLFAAMGGDTTNMTSDQISECIQYIADHLPEGFGTFPKAAAVSFTAEGATAETCATAIAAIIASLKEVGIMET